MTPADRNLLAQNRLLRNISLDSIKDVLEECEFVTIAIGEQLFRIGELNTSLYLILEGELRVYLGTGEHSECLTLGTGECTGELSMIDRQPTSARVIATQETRMLKIPHDRVWSLVDSSHGIARNLLSILVSRLRKDTLALVATQERSLEFELAASVDALTGLHNRRWLDEAFPRAMKRCEYNHAPLCMVMVDIDLFKNFNDTHGHLAGDGALRVVARVLMENLRPQDLLTRYGGEEFAVMLPETSVEWGMMISERLRAAVENTVLHPALELADACEDSRKEHLYVTISLGVATMSSGDTLNSLIAKADEALYEAKRSGRNQVQVASSIS